MIRKILTLFIICFIASSTWATENNSIVKWQKWSPNVFEQARREGRLVLLNLTAEWCQFCRKMDETSYRSPQVINIIMHNYIPVRADSALRYENDARPTTVIFDGNGIEIIKRQGYLRPQWLAQNPSHEAHR